MHCSGFLAPLPLFHLPLNHPPAHWSLQQQQKKKMHAHTPILNNREKKQRVFLHSQAAAESPPLSLSSLRIDPPLSHLCTYILLSVLWITAPDLPLLSFPLIHSSLEKKNKRCGSFIYISLSLSLSLSHLTWSISLTPKPSTFPPNPSSHSSFISTQALLFAFFYPTSLSFLLLLLISQLFTNLCVLFL